MHVVITAGPTREPIDPVRFISNRSSGKMGFAVGAGRGAAGAQRDPDQRARVSIDTPPGVRAHRRRERAEQMYDAVHRELPATDIFISAAAVADYRPPQAQAQKIKKSGDTLHLDLVKAPDILASVAASPRRPFVVGFAAETERVEQHAREKLLQEEPRHDRRERGRRGPGVRLRRQRAARAVARRSATLERAAEAAVARGSSRSSRSATRLRSESPARQRAHV